MIVEDLLAFESSIAMFLGAQYLWEHLTQPASMVDECVAKVEQLQESAARQLVAAVVEGNAMVVVEQHCSYKLI